MAEGEVERSTAFDQYFADIFLQVVLRMSMGQVPTAEIAASGRGRLGR